MERYLVQSLTDACERAKSELPGFCWLTHVVDFDKFPDSLLVIWVFKASDDVAAAIKSGGDSRMLELTEEALSEVDVSVDSISSHVAFDSEEECRRVHGGDWVKRLKSRAQRH